MPVSSPLASVSARVAEVDAHISECSSEHREVRRPHHRTQVTTMARAGHSRANSVRYTAKSDRPSGWSADSSPNSGRSDPNSGDYIGWAANSRPKSLLNPREARAPIDARRPAQGGPCARSRRNPPSRDAGPNDLVMRNKRMGRTLTDDRTAAIRNDEWKLVRVVEVHSAIAEGATDGRNFA